MCRTVDPSTCRTSRSCMRYPVVHFVGSGGILETEETKPRVIGHVVYDVEEGVETQGDEEPSQVQPCRRSNDSQGCPKGAEPEYLLNRVLDGSVPTSALWKDLPMMNLVNVRVYRAPVHPC